MSYLGKRLALFLFILSSFFILFSTPAFCADEPIAALTDFSGTVLIKSHGSWGVEPRENLPLYSQDKVITRIGNATITFNDGAVLNIENNSNLLIREKEEEKGLVRKAETVKRHVLLFLGKMFFKTGKEKIETRFESATAVIGIRGTAGTLSIGADGELYIKFTVGDAAYTVGTFVEGVARPLAQDAADQNPVQKAGYLADDIARRCKEAREQAARGEISEVQADWICAKAAEMASLEVVTWATILIETSPDLNVVEWGENLIEIERDAILDSLELQQNAIDIGAVPYLEGYEPPETPLSEALSREGVSIQSELEPAPRYGVTDVGRASP
jgi:hypothetical protein